MERLYMTNKGVLLTVYPIYNTDLAICWTKEGPSSCSRKWFTSALVMGQIVFIGEV